MMQNVVVALIVGAAALFVARRYLPAAIRDPLLARLAGAARAAHLPRVAQWLDPAARVAAGCGAGCGTCHGCATPPTRGVGYVTVPEPHSHRRLAKTGSDT